MGYSCIVSSRWTCWTVTSPVHDGRDGNGLAITSKRMTSFALATCRWCTEGKRCMWACAWSNTLVVNSLGACAQTLVAHVCVEENHTLCGLGLERNTAARLHDSIFNSYRLILLWRRLMSKWRREETLKLYNELEGIKNDPAYENETARRILYHARLALLKHSGVVFAEGDAIAIQLLMRTEMGLAYNYSMPGRGI